MPDHKEIAFITWLSDLVGDRGAMATLRRGLGKPPGTVHQMDRYVLKFLSGEAEETYYQPYYLVASLFAFWHQGKDKVFPDPPPNLGVSLRSLVDKEGGNRDEAEKRIEKRLVALLNCHRDDLSDHLRHIISLLKSKDVPINWAQLLHDIKGWDWESRSVQRSWARAFWIGTKEPAGMVNASK